MVKIAALVALAVSLVTYPQERSTPRVLTEMRQAMGGEEAFAAIKTFSLRGTLARDVGERVVQFQFEMQCELPDKCVRATTQRDTPAQLTVVEGYNGDDPINFLDAPRLRGMPPFMTQPSTPEALAARRARELAHAREEVARLSLALFGASLSPMPIEFTDAGPDNLDGRVMDAVEVKFGKDFSGRLLVDADTHLPTALVWKTPPRIVMTTTQSVMTRRGETREASQPAISNPLKLPPDAVGVTSQPTPEWIASLPLLERRRVFSAFAREGGVLWPRKIEDFAGGQLVEALKIDSVKLNPRIDPKRFAPRR